MSLPSTALLSALKASSVFIGTTAATFIASCCALTAFNAITEDRNKEDSENLFNFKAFYLVSGISLLAGVLSTATALSFSK